MPFAPSSVLVKMNRDFWVHGRIMRSIYGRRDGAARQAHFRTSERSEGGRTTNSKKWRARGDVSCAKPIQNSSFPVAES